MPSVEASGPSQRQHPRREKRLRFLDGLRGIAATLVLLYHLVGRTRIATLTDRGYLGVAIFFVLSGFVITSVLAGRRMSLGFLGRFALRRMIRLDLPYWVNIVVVLLMMGIAAKLGVPKNSISVAQVAAHLVYLQTLLGYPEISSVYWTLCLEVQFYLTLILLLWGAQRIGVRRSYFLLGFMILMGASAVSNTSWIHTPDGLMFPYWWAFALGALCYWTVAGEASVLYLAVGCVVLAGSAFAPHGDWRVTATVTAALIYLAWRRNAMDAWLTDRVSQFLGRTSYSLYLFHPVVGWSAQSLALRYVNQWLALAAGISASLVASWIAYRLIERPSINLSHRVSLAPKNAQACASAA
jgi:peptidoglycan/LPS O-acetylase OafA/YrhL